MTPEQRETLNRLRNRAVEEKETLKFLEIIRELNDLFETEERRLQANTSK